MYEEDPNLSRKDGRAFLRGLEQLDFFNFSYCGIILLMLDF